MTITGAVSRGIRCLSLLSATLPVWQVVLVHFGRPLFEGLPYGSIPSFFRCAALAGVILSALSLCILEAGPRARPLEGAHFAALLICAFWLWINCLVVPL
ncbi:MAG: hypothetical protein JNM84_24330 [Planctomycetes bacterium]|nr:hypothetical protein [Planctomycetota bacterium]